MRNIPTQQRLSQIPKLYETENIPLKEKLIYLHFFFGDCDWYVCEFDGQNTFWGFVVLNNDLFNAEWGYFSFSELKAIRVYNGMEIDCELNEYWEVRSSSEVCKISQAQGWYEQPNSLNRFNITAL